MLHKTGALEVKVLPFNFGEGGTLVWYQLSSPINQVETGSIPKINTKYSTLLTSPEYTAYLNEEI